MNWCVVTHHRHWRAGGRAAVAECKVMIECDIMTTHLLLSPKHKPDFESQTLTVQAQGHIHWIVQKKKHVVNYGIRRGVFHMKTKTKTGSDH
jgi:hypothetical protein